MTIVLTSPGSMSSRCHCPMHGPHAFASTVAPIASRSASSPSRSIVARTCSEPGRDHQRRLDRQPCAAGLARDVRGAADVLVRRVGARADERGRDLDRVALGSAAAARPRRSGGRGRACAGRRGAARASTRSISIDAVVEALGVGVDLGVVCAGARRTRSARSAISSRPVALRYARACCASYGNSEHVAPISAPMLQIVALPVAEIDSAPGPKYSTIAPVPPFTVRMPATLRITSFGAVQPESVAGQPHADELRHAGVERPARHHVDGVGAADADRDHAEPAGVRRVRVGADHHPARERVVLEHDLVDDPASPASRSRCRTSPTRVRRNS